MWMNAPFLILVTSMRTVVTQMEVISVLAKEDTQATENIVDVCFKIFDFCVNCWHTQKLHYVISLE